MSQQEKSKGTQVRKGTKRFEARDVEARIAEVIKARDAAQKQAVGLHAEFQKLSQHAADLEAHLLELDEQLKKARDDGDKDKARAAELDDQLKKAKPRAAEVDEQLKKTKARVADLEKQLQEASARPPDAEFKKLQGERDHAKAESGKARLRAADLERRVHETTAQALKATSLEHEVAQLKQQLEDQQKDLRKVRDEAGKAGMRAAESDRRSHDEVGMLRKQLEEARDAVLKFQTVQEEAQALATRRENELLGLRRQLEDLQQELKTSREVAAKVPDLERTQQEESAALRKQLDEARESAKTLQAERDQVKEKAEKALAKAEEQTRGAAGMQEATATLRKRLEDSRSEVKLIQETRQKIEQKAAAAEARAAEMEKQVKELSARLTKGAGLLEEIDRTRRQLDESKTELKKVQETREKGEQRAVKAEARTGELEQQVKDLPGVKRQLEESRAEVKKLQDGRARSDARIAELDQQVKELTARVSKSHETGKRRLEESQAQAKKRMEELEQQLQGLTDVHRQFEEARAESRKLRESRDQAEARTAEANRYFESMEKTLLEAQTELAKAKEGEAEARDLRATAEHLKAENAKLEEIRRDLERRLRESAPLPPPAPKPQPSSSLDSLFATAVTEPVPAPAPSKPSPSTGSSLDSIFDAEPPAPAAQPRPKTSVPPAQAVPGPANSPETTLRPQHTFGPPAEDGQPKYVLHELLPTDELGVIYRASERSNNRQFAVRFLSGQAGEAQTQAIEREVEKLIALPHPNILHVQGSGRRKNRLYLAMDLVQAPTLGRAKIHDLKRVCAIVRDAAAAVHYAHEEQIFHGDLHPDNIIVAPGEGRSDVALVKDFALGYLIETLILPPPATPKDPRKHVRNVAYLPPEQVDAAKPKLSVAGDVYSLGATLYAALASRPPFEGKDAAQLRTRVMFTEPVALNKVRPDVPEAVLTVVRRAMVKESGLRTATAGQVADALTKFLG